MQSENDERNNNAYIIREIAKANQLALEEQNTLRNEVQYFLGKIEERKDRYVNRSKEMIEIDNKKSILEDRKSSAVAYITEIREDIRTVLAPKANNLNQTFMQEYTKYQQSGNRSYGGNHDQNLIKIGENIGTDDASRCRRSNKVTSRRVCVNCCRAIQHPNECPKCDALKEMHQCRKCAFKFSTALNACPFCNLKINEEFSGPSDAQQYATPLWEDDEEVCG